MAPGAPAAPAVAAPPLADQLCKRKVKVNSVLDQADEAEVPELKPDELDGYIKVLEETGDRAITRPSVRT